MILHFSVKSSVSLHDYISRILLQIISAKRRASFNRTIRKCRNNVATQSAPRIKRNLRKAQGFLLAERYLITGNAAIDKIFYTALLCVCVCARAHTFRKLAVKAVFHEDPSHFVEKPTSAKRNLYEMPSQ